MVRGRLERWTTMELMPNGVDAKDMVRSKEIKKTATIIGGQRAIRKRRRLVGNRVVLNSFGNRGQRAEHGLETRPETRLGAGWHKRAKHGRLVANKGNVDCVARIGWGGKRRRGTRDRRNSRSGGR